MSDLKSEVLASIKASSGLRDDVVEKEVNHFMTTLGLDEHYFNHTPAAVIASHILNIYAAKVLSGSSQTIRLEQEGETRAMFAVDSQPGKQSGPAHSLEVRLEQDYMGEGYQGASKPEFEGRRWCLSVYRTNAVSDSNTKMRMYLLRKPVFGNESPAADCVDLDQVADKQFLEEATDNTRSLYSEILGAAVKSACPIIKVFTFPETNEARVVVCYRHGSTHSYFNAMTSAYQLEGLTATRKYVEQFSNGLSMYSVYLQAGDGGCPGKASLERFSSALSKLYVLPQHSLTHLIRSATLTPTETAYAYAAWKFSYHFVNRYSKNYSNISEALAATSMSRSEIAALMNPLKAQMRLDAFTESAIRVAIENNPVLVKALYADFESMHAPGSKGEFSTSRNPELASKIVKEATSEFDSSVLLTALSFNRHILRTNFFKGTKTALGFHLSPEFLGQLYPELPYAVFLFVGAEFRGFHVRFSAVSRGGVRMIRSRGSESYSRNAATLFDENYNLALTQQRKNKDIPEGGSKGTILLTRSQQSPANATSAFMKYARTLLDLILPTKEMVDYLGSEDLVFLGPDEGTADLMDAGSLLAKECGYSYWKGFTTGKSTSVGGIPHDLYGMTTRSVHSYVLGLLEKNNLKEDDIFKCQTGGPDGDLGSNEILISKDNTTCIVDGSGVLYDPKGCNRPELERLATERKMVEHFDCSLLSSEGFRVLCSERDITLPSGEGVASGLHFRNTFHLTSYFTENPATLFVPCGGRPQAVNASNVSAYINDDGTPKFKFIVEGANLFFTQAARMSLVNAGSLVVKDASANKGGVTSSSLEVLSSLALSDAEHSEHMCVKDGVIPPFYSKYVKEVQRIISENASGEFEALWKDSRGEGGIPMPILTDKLSVKINSLNVDIQSSSLWGNPELRKKVLLAACPKNLVELIGYEALVARVPEAYLKAIFGSYISSRFVYLHGLKSSEMAFFDFCNNL